MKSLFSLILLFLLLSLSACNENKEKLRQKEIKDWMEISDFLDNEVETKRQILRQKVNNPYFFLRLTNEERKDAYSLYKALDSSLSLISQLQKEIKEYYSQNKNSKKNNISELDFFHGNDTILALTISWTVNQFIKSDNNQISNYITTELNEITNNKYYFRKDYKNINIPLALARLSELKRNLIPLYYIIVDYKYKLFPSQPNIYNESILPLVVSRKDCIKIGEAIDAEIFIGTFIPSSYIEIYATKLSDSESKLKKEPLQKIKVKNGRSKITLKANSIGTKFITGKILYTDFEGDTQEVKFIKEFTVIK